MLFKKGKKKSPESSDPKQQDDRSITGEFELALGALDETIEQKKTVLSSAKKLTQKLADSIPPSRKVRTA